jgi:hypothetical protein
VRASQDERSEDRLNDNRQNAYWEVEDEDNFVPPANSSSGSQPEGRRTNGPSAVKVFWYTTLVLIGLGFVIGVFLAVKNGDPSDAGNGLLGAGIVMLMVFPGMQLLAVVISLFFVPLRKSERTNLGRDWSRLGKIALGTILGSVVGFGLMVFLFQLFQ